MAAAPATTPLPLSSSTLKSDLLSGPAIFAVLSYIFTFVQSFYHVDPRASGDIQAAIQMASVVLPIVATIVFGVFALTKHQTTQQRLSAIETGVLSLLKGKDTAEIEAVTSSITQFIGTLNGKIPVASAAVMTTPPVQFPPDQTSPAVAAPAEPSTPPTAAPTPPQTPAPASEAPEPPQNPTEPPKYPTVLPTAAPAGPEMEAPVPQPESPTSGESVDPATAPAPPGVDPLLWARMTFGTSYPGACYRLTLYNLA